MLDTAGIRETEDIVERIGVERSRQVLKEADLILLVLNYADELTMEDENLFEAVKGMDVIVIVNKTDLPQQIDLDELRNWLADHKIVTTSLLEDRGVDELEEAIASLFFAGSLKQGFDLCFKQPPYCLVRAELTMQLKKRLEGVEYGNAD